MSVRFALLVLAVLGVSCGAPEPPVWIPIAGAPEVGADESVPAEFSAAGRSFRFAREDGDLWLATTLGAEAWTGGEADARHAGRNLFRARLPFGAVGQARELGRAAYRLEADGRSFRYTAQLDEQDGADLFTTSVLEITLALGPDATPPARAELFACANLERREGATRVLSGRRISGEGFALLPGRPRTFTGDLPPDSALRFATTAETALVARELREATRTFKVALEGAPLLEHVQTSPPDGESCVWHTLALPRGGGKQVKLTFELEGPFGYGGIFAPTIGPASIGRPGARPWKESRPDLVVFLADTFRADNLAPYGGDPALAPELARFAASARVFSDARSVSTHTLPAHATMFSGLYPHELGLVDYWNPLPSEVETLAELLSLHGYRAGAVSDGGMVSSSHGLDQGFAWFDERRGFLDERRADLASTLARAESFLAADDGRPVFLFVQTYAVHTPYTVSREQRERLGLAGSFEELQSRLKQVEGKNLVDESVPGTEEAVAGMRALYQGSVGDLDSSFGRFHAALEGRGYFEHGVLLFTSDHGEAFLEHAQVFHAGHAYEEQLRIPFLIRGPGIAPGVDGRAASLIDFAPTLFDLAGFEPQVHWRGSSLLGTPSERTVFAFQSRGSEEFSTLAVLEGKKKVIGYEDANAIREGKLFAAYDLAEDPREEIDEKEEEWAAELARRYGAELEELLRPRVRSEPLQLTGEEMRELGGLGYVDTDTDEGSSEEDSAGPR